MTHKINIPYFPNPLRYIALVALPAAAWLVYIEQLKWGILLALLIVFIFTAKYVTTIDFNTKDITDAFSFFGIKLVSERESFKSLDKIVISKGNYSQKVTTRSSDRQINWSDYTGTLIYDGDKSLDLLTRNDKQELMNELRVYATTLKVNIED